MKIQYTVLAVLISILLAYGADRISVEARLTANATAIRTSEENITILRSQLDRIEDKLDKVLEK